MRYFLLVLFLCSSAYAEALHFKRIAVANNPCEAYSLANSVDFHPHKNVLCVTYTFGNRVVLYDQTLRIVQTLANPEAELQAPQHAVFTPDGKVLVVANWMSQTFTLYAKQAQGGFSATPTAVIFTPEKLAPYRFHGIAFSRCGQFLAVAYGAGSDYDRAIGIFKYDPTALTLTLVHCLCGEKEVLGVPKGIAFAPDGNALLVTFSDLNALAVYPFSKKHQTLAYSPRQIVRGPDSQIFRPEDVKLSQDGTLLALSNSDAGNVSIFPFNPHNNTITQSSPRATINKKLVFPHGLAFSPDGTLLAITQFGGIHSDEKGDIFWSHITNPSEAKIFIYTVESN